MSNKDSYIVTFQSSEIDTLGQWLKYQSSPVYPKQKTPLNEKGWEEYAEEFLTYSNEVGVTNKNAILSKLQDYDKIAVTKLKPFDWPIQVGTSFTIPFTKVSREGLLLEGIQVASTNEPAFKAEKLAQLENDLGYKKVLKTSSGTYGNLQEMTPDLTVWMWCRSLTDDGEKEMSGKIFDLTPFIISCNSGSTKQGGNFNISLSPITCEKDEKGKWVIKKASFKVDETKSKIEYIFEGTIVTPLDKNSGAIRSRFLFHDMVNTNDLIFIRYDALELEKKIRYEDQQNLFINKENLPGRVYDMIGLVDSNTQTINSQRNDVSINIRGRDLSKLVIEDGTYFYAFENKEGKPKFMGQSSQKSEIGQRIVGTGSLYFLNLYFHKGIKEVLQFVLDQLSSIKVIPDDLFSFYDKKSIEGGEIVFDKKRRNRTLMSSKQSKENDQKFEEDIKERIGGIKERIKEQRIKEKLNVKDEEKEKLSSNRIFDDIYSFLTSGLQSSKNEQTGEYTSALVVTEGNLVGWVPFQWVSEVVSENTTPITLNYDLLKDHTNAWSNKIVKDIFDKVYKVIKLREDRIKTKSNEKLEDELLPGIWQIVKLVIDKSVSNRRITDSSMTTASGSLLNFIRKVCQDPFVEFYMDTYGDEFYFIVRKPPYDKIGVQTLLDGSVTTEKGSTKITQSQAVITVKEDDVHQESLSFDDQQAYSWYHFVPQNSFAGNTSTFSTNYIPAIVFPKYAEIWGSRSLDLVHNYMPYLGLDNKKDNSSLSYFEKQAFEDMAYLVNSHQYLPFTRKGIITINRDRRLKVGNLMRYEPTGEIFFIDSVQHTHQIGVNNIDGTTTINVSRGMVESFIKGVDISFKRGGSNIIKNVSYFNIINTTLNDKAIKESPKKGIRKTTTETTIRETPVNQVPITTNENIFQMNSPIATTYSQQAVDFIKKREGYRNKPYLDGGSYAIGYGNHKYENGKPVRENDPSIDQTRAESILRAHLNGVTKEIKRVFNNSIKFSQNELDALHSYVYNTGSVHELTLPIKNYKISPVLYGLGLQKTWLNSRLTEKGKGPKKVPALVSRRVAESSLFFNSNYINTGTTETQVNTIEEEYIIPGEFEYIIDQSQMFNNFVVDNDIFNFFLRKQQFDPKFL